MKMLVLVDGSAGALRAVGEVIKRLAREHALDQVHLLNVQHPLPGTVAESAQSRAYHHEQGVAALASARAMLAEAHINYSYHIGVGEVGSIVAQFVTQLQCDEIVMGTRGMGAVANALLGSAVAKVVRAVQIPVLLVK